MFKQLTGLFSKVKNLLTEPTPGEPHLHKQKGYTHLEAGEPQAAIEEFNLALKKNQADAEIYLARGNAHCLLKDWDAALKDYGLVMVLGRSELKVSALLVRGKLYLEQGNVARALEDFNDALEREPENTQVITARAQAENLLARQTK